VMLSQTGAPETISSVFLSLQANELPRLGFARYTADKPCAESMVPSRPRTIALTSTGEDRKEVPCRLPSIFRAEAGSHRSFLTAHPAGDGRPRVSMIKTLRKVLCLRG